jgi:hypothetical protein
MLCCSRSRHHAVFACYNSLLSCVQPDDGHHEGPKHVVVARLTSLAIKVQYSCVCDCFSYSFSTLLMKMLLFCEIKQCQLIHSFYTDILPAYTASYPRRLECLYHYLFITVHLHFISAVCFRRIAWQQGSCNWVSIPETDWGSGAPVPVNGSFPGLPQPEQV